MWVASRATASWCCTAGSYSSSAAISARMPVMRWRALFSPASISAARATKAASDCATSTGQRARWRAQSGVRPSTLAPRR